MVVMVFGNVVLRYVFNSGHHRFGRAVALVAGLADLPRRHRGPERASAPRHGSPVRMMPRGGRLACYVVSHLLMLYATWLLLRGAGSRRSSTSDVPAPADRPVRRLVLRHRCLLRGARHPSSSTTSIARLAGSSPRKSSSASGERGEADVGKTAPKLEKTAPPPNSVPSERRVMTIAVFVGTLLGAWRSACRSPTRSSSAASR